MRTWAPTGIFPIFRRFRLNLRVFDASAGGASENFRVFSTGTAYDVIVFKFQGGGQLPQVAPLPSGCQWMRKSFAVWHCRIVFNLAN